MYVNYAQIEELLNEQKWTRGALSAFGPSTLEEILTLCEPEISDSDAKELLTLAEGYLSQNKNSVVPLFLAGLMSLKINGQDEQYMARLIHIFSEIHKTSVIELVCKTVLSYEKSHRLALQTLVDVYRQLGNEPDLVANLEKLVLADHSASSEALELAQYYERNNETELAVKYYRKAVFRFIKQGVFTQTQDAWNSLLSLIPDEKDLFMLLQERAANRMGKEKASLLLGAYLIKLKQANKWKDAVEVQKLIFAYSGDSAQARKDLVNSYRKLYAGHSQLEEAIKSAQLLGDSSKSILEAIQEFEKHIAFENGSFVYHRTWGVGRIKELRDTTIIIDFADNERRGHEIDLGMAIRSLEPLVKNHIWILKGVVPKAKLKERVQKDPAWALETVIKSFNNNATLKTIKSELVPDILSAGEWTGWQSKAKQILLTDGRFGNLSEDANTYVVQDTPIGSDQKSATTFKNKTALWDKAATLQEFLNVSDTESEFFGEMFEYFTNNLNALNDDLKMGSYLVVEWVIARYPHLKPSDMPKFSEVLAGCELSLSSLYSKLQTEEFRSIFIKKLRSQENWEDAYLELLPIAINKTMVKLLESADRGSDVKELFQQAVSRYKEFPDLLIWLASTYSKDELVENYDISYERFIIALLGLYSFSFRMVANRRDLSENRKRNRSLANYLFAKDTLFEFLYESNDENLVLRTMSLVSEIGDLKEDIKVELMHKLSTKHPTLIEATQRRDMVFTNNAEVLTKLFALESSYLAKKDELKQLVDVEIPANSQEIALAREHGDLSENAEFKAAKEKQGLLRSKVSKLQEELNKVTIVKLEDIDGSSVGFGTLVELEKSTGEMMSYKILGAWESDLEKGIISNFSPIAKQLYGKQKGDEVSYELDGKTHSYKILGLRALTQKDL